MSSDIKPGDEVVCVSNTPIPGNDVYSLAYLNLLEVGKVYVVDRIEPSKLNPKHIIIGVTSIFGYDGQSYGFKSTRFRKVQKKFTGMETLTALLLNPAKELEHAE